MKIKAKSKTDSFSGDVHACSCRHLGQAWNPSERRVDIWCIVVQCRQGDGPHIHALMTTFTSQRLPHISSHKNEHKNRCLRETESFDNNYQKSHNIKRTKKKALEREINIFLKSVTSGARYSGVPQKVFMVAASVMPSLQSPKSVILIWPSLSSIRFSNWNENKISLSSNVTEKSTL